MNVAVDGVVKIINEAIDKGVPVSLIQKMQMLADEGLQAAEKLRSADNTVDGKQALEGGKLKLADMEAKESVFLGAIEIMDDGDEGARAAAKRIPLCEAEEAQSEQKKRIVCEG